MAIFYQCDGCGRNSLQFRYWQCPSCGTIACDDCASKAGANVVNRTRQSTDSFFSSLAKTIGAAISRTCPSCEMGFITIVHDP
jgi:hypothetical protein